MGQITAGEVWTILGHGELIGSPETAVEGLNLCNRTTEKSSILSYATSDAYIGRVRENPAVRMLLVSAGHAAAYESVLLERGGCLLVSGQPEADFYAVHEALCARGGFYPAFDFPPRIGPDCRIHPSAVIENGVVLGARVTVGPQSVIRSGTVIEDDVSIGCCSVIGSEGFQVIFREDGAPYCATHTGGVHVCGHVWVGDNVCIAKSLFEGETYIGDHVKIDNQVHVAHNLHIARNAVVTAQCVLCGSSAIEEHAWLGVNTVVLNRVTIGAYAKTGIGSVVTRDVSPHTLVYGVPAKPHEHGKEAEK